MNILGPKVLIALREVIETGNYDFTSKNSIRFYHREYEDGELILTAIEVNWKIEQ